MTFRRLVVGIALLCLTAGVTAIPAADSAFAAGAVQNVASESYYRLDVAAGTLTVHVDATVQNGGSTDLATAALWAMPKASNIVVKADDTVLETKVVTSPDPDIPTIVGATLPKPLKRNIKTELTLDYDVPAHNSAYVHMEPGDLELVFVSQGPGSFVYVDVPAQAENYFDPGCLKASDQPGSVKDAGFERWICGEATVIALNADHPDVLKKCADADDRCRQTINPSPYSAFVQSITDQSQRGTLEADVNLQNGPVKLVLRFFRRDQKWADRQFAVAKAAVPLLEQTYGFPYPGKEIQMLQSHHIEMIGAAGVAFPDQGEVLLATDTGFDEEVTVHELAHQWAGTNLSTSWLWEGLAEYGMRTVAPSLGITPIDRRWQSFPYKDTLATWHNGSTVTNPDYWYGKAGAFWFAYQQAIGGPDNMRAVLSQISPEKKHEPFDGKWFMDAGERVSGANLDSLFLSWVFNPDTATTLLKDRRAVHDLVNALTARAASMGLSGVPVDLQSNLDAWTFSGVDNQVAQSGAALDAYASVLAAATAAGLPSPDAVAKSWGSAAIAQTRGVIEDQRQAISAITDATGRLAGEPEGSPSLRQLDQARQEYANGHFDAAEELAATSTTTAFNEVAAVKLIAAAKAKQADFKPSFLSRIGLLFSDPDGDLAEAQRAYDSGDPTRAVKLARSAYETWDGASARGLQFLAILAGVMCGLSGLIWYLLRRLDGPPKDLRTLGVAGPRRGKAPPEPERPASSWRDWENTPEHRG
jgi:hypothetical protein